jgi:hypothetical protein
LLSKFVLTWLIRSLRKTTMPVGSGLAPASERSVGLQV